MKKRDSYTFLVWCSLVMLLISSCSGDTGMGDRSGESSFNANTSQVHMCTGVEGGAAFTSDLGYAISIESGNIFLRDFHLDALSETDSEETGVEMEGPYSINLLQQQTDLGFHNGTPGDYNTFSFLINSPDSGPPLQITGTASKDSQTYPFHSALSFDSRVSIGSLEIPIVTGHYKSLALVLELDHWCDGIDFASATVTEGIIYITTQENASMAKNMSDQITSHMRIDILDN